MSIGIRFVGGPADGCTLAIPDDVPPFRYLIPLAMSIADLMASQLEPSPIRAAEYEPMLEGGWPRQADDGVFLYRHRVVPLTPDERGALAESRREARAAGERRAAELDKAWREIRRERPHFPEDRRDLF